MFRLKGMIYFHQNVIFYLATDSLIDRTRWDLAFDSTAETAETKFGRKQSSRNVVHNNSPIDFFWRQTNSRVSFTAECRLTELNNNIHRRETASAKIVWLLFKKQLMGLLICTQLFCEITHRHE